MANVTTQTTPLFSALAANFADFIQALRADAEAHRAYTRTFNELSALSNDELADIGIGRGMIDQIAYEAAYGLPRD